MKMITKVFLVIAILIICLIAWGLFLGDGGILQNAWNGIAGSINDTWKSITGATDDVIPQWNSQGVTDVGDGTGKVDVATGGSTTTGP